MTALAPPLSLTAVVLAELVVTGSSASARAGRLSAAVRMAK
jgi:outer membrane murein-binding lipoprotein Lpp